MEQLPRANRRLVIRNGNLHRRMHAPNKVAAEHARLRATYGDRFMLGLGVSHAPFVDQAFEAGHYTKPLEVMTAYLDALDAAPDVVPAGSRLIAALGPKMLGLAAKRTAGTHPYFVTPAHTAAARAAVGPGVLVAPEQAVLLETDATAARAAARAHMSVYLGLPNYTNNLLRHGFTADDLAGGGSDRLVDAIVAWGGPSAIAERVAAHREAGADHVALQVLTVEHSELPLEAWRTLAPVLLG